MGTSTRENMNVHSSIFKGKEGSKTNGNLPIRTRIPFDCEKAHHENPKHLTKLLVQLETRKHFSSSDGRVSVQGIIISFMKKQKQRDIDKILPTIPASFKTVPILLVDL